MERAMRRQDRRVTDPAVLADILNTAQVMHLGLADEGRVYVVPLNYGWTEEAGRYTLYAHSAGEGRKIDLIGQGTAVGFEMACDIAYFDADTACGWGNRYRSIIGEGRARLLESPEEKRRALAAIMAHYSQRSDFTYDEKMVALVQVIAIDVTALSGKVHE